MKNGAEMTRRGFLGTVLGAVAAVATGWLSRAQACERAAKATPAGTLGLVGPTTPAVRGRGCSLCGHGACICAPNIAVGMPARPGVVAAVHYDHARGRWCAILEGMTPAEQAQFLGTMPSGVIWCQDADDPALWVGIGVGKAPAPQ